MIRQLIFGVDQLNPRIKKHLMLYGRYKIINIQICRKPIQQHINTLLNVLSFGQFEENLKNSEYDKLFHLFLYITIETNLKIVLEKNERINLEINYNKLDNQTEFLNIDNINNNNLTLNILLENTKKQMGETNFFKYSSHSYNCQNFVLNVLSSNGLLNEEYKKFIYQDTKQLFNNLGYLKILSDKITDLGASMNIIKEGGRIKNNYIIQSILFDKNKYDINKASLWLYDNNFKFNKVDITDNFLRFRQTRPLKKYKYYTRKHNKYIKYIIAYN
jgi:hypothetical protein